jgi:hypothetical protein
MAVPDTNIVVHTVVLVGLAHGQDVQFQLPAGAAQVYTTYCDDPCTTLVLHWITPKPQMWDYRTKSFSVTTYTSFTAPRTMPETGFRLVQVSDSHGRNFSTPLMVQAVQVENPHVVIHSGDLATTNGGSNPPTTLYTLLDQLNAMRDSQGRIVPFLPNVGNHECWNGSEGFQWSGGTTGRKPNWDTDERGDVEWYLCLFPTWPGIRGFGVLDFGDYCSIWQLNPGIYALMDDPADSQVEWLAESLSERASVPHKIASSHYNPYEWGRRAFTPYLVAQRDFGRILYNGGCRTFFVGHSHVIGYSVPIDKWGPTDHQVEHTPARVGEGVEIFGSGTPGIGVDASREGRNPATKWWIADSMPLEIEYYDYEKASYTGPASYLELRDPHPDDGREFSMTETAHYWTVSMTRDGRTVSAINSLGDSWVTLERPLDPM